MIKRSIHDILLNSLKNYPVVGILGSRQVGKTTLAQAIKQLVKKDTVYLDLELPSDMNKLQDAEMYLRQFEKSLVIIDEIQRMPSLYPLLRALVDQNRIGKTGLFQWKSNILSARRCQKVSGMHMKICNVGRGM